MYRCINSVWNVLDFIHCLWYFQKLCLSLPNHISVGDMLLSIRNRVNCARSEPNIDLLHKVCELLFALTMLVTLSPSHSHSILILFPSVIHSIHTPFLLHTSFILTLFSSVILSIHTPFWLHSHYVLIPWSYSIVTPFSLHSYSILTLFSLHSSYILIFQPILYSVYPFHAHYCFSQH